MVNLLHDSMKSGTGKEALGAIIGGLVSYTESHFADEEQLMEKHSYPGMQEHKFEHEKLVKQVQDLHKQFKSGQTILTLGVMMFLKDWLIKHIQGDDKKFGAFLNSQGVF
jgi:hemerythrin